MLSAHTVCLVMKGTADRVRPTLSVQADILALADILLVDNTSRIRPAHIVCFTGCGTSGWGAAHFQVAWVTLESLQTLADAEAVLHETLGVWPADTVLAWADAVSVVVDAGHAGASVAAVAVRLAQAVLRGRGKGGGGRPSSRRLRHSTPSGGSHGTYGGSGHVSAASGNHAARTLRRAGKQGISGHSLRTDAPEAAKCVDAASVSATNTATSQAFVDVIAVSEGISLKTRWTSAVQPVSGSKALCVGTTT